MASDIKGQQPLLSCIC